MGNQIIQAQYDQLDQIAARFSRQAEAVMSLALALTRTKDCSAESFLPAPAPMSPPVWVLSPSPQPSAP